MGLGAAGSEGFYRPTILGSAFQSPITPSMPSCETQRERERERERHRERERVCPFGFFSR